MNNKFKLGILLCAASAVLLCSCEEEWLDTKPLSFYTPENTYVNPDGFYAALATCEQHIRGEFYGSNSPIMTPYIGSEMMVRGDTDKKGPEMNLDVSYLPDATLNDTDYTKLGWYWEKGYNGAKHANVIIARIDNTEWSSESERNAVLGAAYFHRAYWYYKLVNAFGDVPYVDWEVNEPKLDFFTYDRWGIIEKECKNLESAYQWLSDDVDRGRTTKSGCGVLLMKYYMMLDKYDEALAIGKEIVAKHPLMTEMFTSAKADHKNLQFDLHSIEAKLDLNNTEGLFYVMAYPNVDGSTRIQTIRNVGPNWDSNSVVTPDGIKGFEQNCLSELSGTEDDVNKTYGRGQAMMRPQHYYQYDCWGPKERNDERGIYNTDSWKSIWQFRYNHSKLKTANSPYFLTYAVKPAVVSAEDSIRSWFHYPHYKVWVPDPLQTQVRGGETPWYIYRSAEVYLLMGECYYWKSKKSGASNLAQAAEMLNVVRRRAGAEDLTADEITIDEILKERARELFYEEDRHMEEVRISYTYAKYGYECEFFGNRKYSLDNISGPGGTGSNVKEEGYNFWFDYVNHWTSFYNKGIYHKYAEYKCSVHHILWPIPATAINANTKGHINQNIGYPGAEDNIEPLEVPMDHTAIGPDATE